MKISFCISTYKDVEMLAQLVLSLTLNLSKFLGKNGFEVVVLDDGSPNSWAEDICNLCEKLRFKHIWQPNLGSRGAAQTLVEDSSGDVICLLDNDLVVPNGWLQSLTYFFDHNSRFGVASWKSRKMELHKLHEWYLYREDELYLHREVVGENKVPERATELAAYCYAFRREIFDLVGGFDSRFKYFIWDSDFCCSLAEEGYTSYRILYPYVYHVEHATMDAHPELEARKFMMDDFKEFEKKWGDSPRGMQETLLKTLPKQRIKWLTKEGEREGWNS